MTKEIMKTALFIVLVLLAGTLGAQCQPPQIVAGGGSWCYVDSLNVPIGTRIGSVSATPERIRTLVGDLGAGSAMYGSCTPTMSKGDLAAVELVKIGGPALDMTL